MPIRRTRTSPQLLLHRQPIIVADAGTSEPATAAGDPGTVQTFRALGYRQTKLSAAQGGKANAKGFRFRNEGMRALARSFRGQPFIGAHDWGDPRARGGTIVNAWAEDMTGGLELGILYDVDAQAAWAKEGLANGTIDRFSLGADPIGEITCTIHEAPVWSTEGCFCWMGMEVDGMIAEFEDGKGLELSAVNVPAVDGTAIVPKADRELGALRGALGAGVSLQDYQAIAAHVGRENPRLAQALSRRSVSVPAQQGVSTPPTPPITMTPCTATAAREAKPMDPILLRKSLGLPATATDDEVLAKINANASAAAGAAVLERQLGEVADREQARMHELDAAHVEAEITRLRASRQVSDEVVADLRVAAAASRSSFDSSLALVEKTAPKIAPGPGAARATLQSDAAAAANPGAAALDGNGPDAYEANRSNPELASMMRGCGVTAAQVREFGSRTFNVVPELAKLVDNTYARGDRPGMGK